MNDSYEPPLSVINEKHADAIRQFERDLYNKGMSKADVRSTVEEKSGELREAVIAKLKKDNTLASLETRTFKFTIIRTTMPDSGRPILLGELIDIDAGRRKNIYCPFSEEKADECYTLLLGSCAETIRKVVFSEGVEYPTCPNQCSFGYIVPKEPGPLARCPEPACQEYVKKQAEVCMHRKIDVTCVSDRGPEILDI